jgi:ribosomal protein S11
MGKIKVVLMEIQSAFNSGIQGFQKATDEAGKAAANIAAETAARRDDSIINEINVSQTATNKEQQIPELNKSIVDLRVAEFQAKSSVQVIKTADDVLGTLIDVSV